MSYKLSFARADLQSVRNNGTDYKSAPAWGQVNYKVSHLYFYNKQCIQGFKIVHYSLFIVNLALVWRINHPQYFGRIIITGMHMV